MDNQAVNEAIEILINNFTRHPRLSHSSDSKLNVFDVLQEFWQLKSNGSLSNNNLIDVSLTSLNSQIVYEYLEKPGPPYVCLCTLPCGACFATFQVYSLLDVLS